jgi:hypothetical protein
MLEGFSPTAMRVLWRVHRSFMVLCGLAIMSLAVIGLFSTPGLAKMPAEGSIRYKLLGQVVKSAFLVVFGLLFLAAETENIAMLKWFAFLTTLVGRGSLLIIAGFLATSVGLVGTTFPFPAVVGGVVICIGAINLIAGAVQMCFKENLLCLLCLLTRRQASPALWDRDIGPHQV